MTASAPLTIYPALRNHRIPQKKAGLAVRVFPQGCGTGSIRRFSTPWGIENRRSQ